MLDKFRGFGRDEWSGRPCLREACHLFAAGIGDGKRLDVFFNLVGMSRDNHQRSHLEGTPSQDDLLAIVAQREKCLQDDIRMAISFLHKLDKRKAHTPELETLMEKWPLPKKSRELVRAALGDNSTGK